MTSILPANTAIKTVTSPVSLHRDEAGKLAEQLLVSCGNGPILHIGPSDTTLLQTFLNLGVQILNADVDQARVEFCEKHVAGHSQCWDGKTLPFADSQFTTVLVTQTPGDLPVALELAEEVLRVSSANVFLYLTPEECSDAPEFRKQCELRFFQAGARKHPAYYRVNDYQALQAEQGKISVPLEKLPDAAVLQYPLSALVEERDLHMDMTREPGSRSDAHIIRYMLASQYVRPGDRVLDAACGLGYGSHILLKCSDAQSVLGIDGSEYAARYADLNFAHNTPGLKFKEGWLPEALRDIPDNSIDLVTSFETLEHVKDPKGLMAEFRRVLTPTGRIILSVPNDWSDETGEDPNPFHFHVYTWEKILAEAQEHFLIEAAFAQTADQYKRNKQWAVGTRQLVKAELETLVESDPECEWCLLVGMKNPLEGSTVPYEETTYDLFPENPNWLVTRFDDYVNPWLVKGIVTIGHRIENTEILQSLSAQAALQSPAGSPDQGAGLCILGYKLYENDFATLEEVIAFDISCQEYLLAEQTSPQRLRWQVSLNYLLGLIWQKRGNSDKATSYFKDCTKIDCTKYSSTLVTKQISAYFNLGLIESGLGRYAEAKGYWSEGILAAERALNLDWTTAYGSLDYPTEFGLHELGAIVEYASSCAYALRYCDNAMSKTPQWWHQLKRDRVSLLRQTDAVRQETTKLNELLIKKDAAIKSIMEASQKEARALYAHTAEKDLVLNQTGIEVERLNRIIESKDELLNETGAVLNQTRMDVERLNRTIESKDELLYETGAELTRLNSVIAEKDFLLSQTGIEIQRLNRLIESKDELLNETGKELTRLNGFLTEKDELLNQLGLEINRLNSVTREKELLVSELGLEISRLNLVIHENVISVDALNQQLSALQEANEQRLALEASREAEIEINSAVEKLNEENFALRQALEQEQIRYNLLRQGRTLRWVDALKARPLSARALAKIVYLTTGMMTPAPLRRRLGKVLTPAVNRLRKPLPAAVAATSTLPESGYIVKVPQAPEKNRPVVVHIIANFMTGGSSRLVVDIFEHLGNQYDQRVVTSFAPTPAAYIGIPIDEIRFPNDELPFIEKFEELKPDFIHMHYWGDCDEPWYAKSVRAAEILGIPVVENINTPIVPYYSDVIQRYIYVSDYVRHVFGEAEESNHVTVYPGSDFSLFESKQKWKANTDCIGMVYRLENDKLNSESIMPFILAAKKRPSVKVLIVGGGSLMDEFVQATIDAGVAQNFEFTGYVPYSALPGLYERMSLFVAPVWKESFGQVSPFAMNMRVPVVGFDIGAIGEIVDDPSLLAPAGNSDALADIIVSLLSDDARRQQIAERHRKRAQDYYSIQAMIKGYQGIYNGIMVDKKK